jgi:general nucleoside transport system permease protein
VLFGTATALSVRMSQMSGLAPQLLLSIPYLVTVLALVIVGWRVTKARSRHGAWRFDLS